MKRVLAIISLSIVLSLSGPGHLPLSAQTDSAPQDEHAFPLGDMLERLLRRFLSDTEPTLRELERGFSALEPEIQRFLDDLRGMTQYHPPEILPNGDILIRRRESAPPLEDHSVPNAEDAAPSDVPFEL